MAKKKLIKDKCEVENCDIIDPNLLELHHILERTEVNTTNHDYNLAILCCLHHAMVGTRLKIIGVYPSTKLPNGRTLIYELDGIRNIEGIDKPLIEFKPKSFKLYEKE